MRASYTECFSPGVRFFADMKVCRHGITLLFTAVLFSLCGSSQNSGVTTPGSSSVAQDPAQIIRFLGHTISWYRELAVEQQLATQPSDVTFYQDNHRVADQVVQLAFDYARSQAQVLAKKRAQQPVQSASTDQYQHLVEAAQKADQQLQDTQSELQSTRAKLATASPAK